MRKPHGKPGLEHPLEAGVIAGIQTLSLVVPLLLFDSRIDDNMSCTIDLLVLVFSRGEDPCPKLEFPKASPSNKRSSVSKRRFKRLAFCPRSSVANAMRSQA